MTTKLKQRRDKVLQELLELAPQILIGSASETYRTCGSQNCRCHGEGPKHGPHMYVAYKGDHGRTTGYYVPVALHQRVRDGHAAWKELHELVKEVAFLNQDIMHAERPKKERRKRE
jgi:hypothetical protein